MRLESSWMRLLLFGCSVVSDSLWPPWTAGRQASLSFTISQSFLKLLFIELVMPSNHLILCRPLLLPPFLDRRDKRLIFPWPHEATRRQPLTSQRAGPPQTLDLTLDFTASRTGSNRKVCCLSHPVDGILLEQLRWLGQKDRDIQVETSCWELYTHKYSSGEA